MKIYIAGKVSDLHYPGVVAKFQHIAKFLKTFAFETVNPMDLIPENTEYELAMDICLAALDKCDAIFLLSDWIDSPGAKRELLHALRLNLVILNQDNIIKYVENNK